MASTTSSSQLRDIFSPGSGQKRWSALTSVVDQLWSLPHEDRRQLAILSMLALAVTTVIAFGTREKHDPLRYKWFERPQQQAGRVLGPVKSRNVATRLAETQADLVILWGSQSGTAEAFSRRLTRDLRRNLQIKACLLDLSDIDPVSLSDLPVGSVVVFLMSTYDNGDPSDNAIEFMAHLTSTSRPLPHLRTAIFGLGNTNYQYYNRIADIVAQRLIDLGAQPSLLIGKADEARLSTEEDFLDWKDQLVRLLSQDLKLGSAHFEYQPTLRVELGEAPSSVELASGMPVKAKAKFRVKTSESAMEAFAIKHSRNLTEGRADGALCLHMDLEIAANSAIRYKTGDYIAVWPSNPDYEVAKLLRQLGLEGKEEETISLANCDSEDSDLVLPPAATVRVLFKHYLQVCAPVSRETISALCHFAPSEEAKAFLEPLANKEEYQRFRQGKYLTLADILQQACPGSSGWSAMPLSFVIESFPIMTSRRYSISSSSKVEPKQISLTVAVKSPLPQDTHTVVPGLATSYLAAATGVVPSSSATGSVLGQIIRSKFKLPFKSETPIILVAAGSGIAPFRAFIHERARLSAMGVAVGEVMLFFGCRHPDQDNLYYSELKQIAETNLANKLKIVTAFSRVEDAPKCYVQDRLGEPETQRKVAQMLIDDAAIYFCGSTVMAKAAGSLIQEGVRKEAGIEQMKMIGWVDEKKKFGKWQEDVWG